VTGTPAAAGAEIHILPDPPSFPPGVRAFLAAISVRPNITQAARAAAEVLYRGESVECVPPAVTWANLRGADRKAAAAAEQERRERRSREIERITRTIRRRHSARMKCDAVYAEAFEEAYRLGVESLEDWACERAMDGWDEPVYQGGILVGYKRKHSERTMLRMLETKLPETWGKRKIEHTGHVGMGVASLTDEQLERIARGGGGGAATPAETVQPDRDLLPGDGPAAPGAVPEAP
jgi:hypothetical protein